MRWVRIWDPFVRLFHWTLVVSFFVAYTTEDETLLLHVWAGYVIGILVPLRIVWGFVGPGHARFSDFVYRPRIAVAYAKDLFRFRARRYLGHSPAGGLMIVALLIVLPVVVWTGLEFYAAEEGAGPLAASPVPALVVGQAVADEDDNDDGDERGRDDDADFWEAAHEWLAHLAFLMVLFHVGGVVLGSIAHRENLVRSMITGYKREE